MKFRQRGFALIGIVLLIPIFFGIAGMIYVEIDGNERIMEASNRYWQLQIAATMAIKQSEIWLQREVALDELVDERVFAASGSSADLEIVIDGSKVPQYTAPLPLIAVETRVYTTDYPAGYLGAGQVLIPRIPSTVYIKEISSTDVERVEPKRYYMIRSIVYSSGNSSRKLIFEKCIALSLDLLPPTAKLQTLYFKRSIK